MFLFMEPIRWRNTGTHPENATPRYQPNNLAETPVQHLSFLLQHTI